MLTLEKRYAAVLWLYRLPLCVCIVISLLMYCSQSASQSALRLQQWWRGHLRRAFWKMYFVKVKACIQIQRMARGVLCRAWLKVWHINRTYRVVRIQAAFRGHCMRNVVKAWKQWEDVNATKIQSIVRGHFGRKHYMRQKQCVAALHIQMLWRGHVSRKQSDLLWLAQKAVNLQRLIRGVLARKAARKRQLLCNTAAVQIQRMFRGMQARTVIHLMLRHRETRNRQELMRVLEVEEEWHRVQRDKAQQRLERLQLYRE